MKSSKFPLVIIAFLIAAATVFAFTTKKAPVKKFDVTYHYTSNSTALQDMKDTSNWEVNHAATGCMQFGDLPCTKTISGDWDDFIDYLDDFIDAGSIIEDADSKRFSGQSK